MNLIHRMALVAVVLAAPAAAVAEDAPIQLKKGDRILFFGDSITEGGGGETGYITLIKNALDKQNKDLDITVINAGKSGHKVPDLQKRVERDVIAKKPTIVFIYIGINDVWHGQNDPAKGTSKEKFEAGLKEMVSKIEQSGARVILCTPTVIGEKKAGGNKLDAKLDEYSDVSRSVAKEMKVPLCDLRKAFVDYLAVNNKDNKATGVLTGDSVHLNPEGNKRVAETMLKMLRE